MSNQNDPKNPPQSNPQGGTPGTPINDWLRRPLYSPQEQALGRQIEERFQQLSGDNARQLRQSRATGESPKAPDYNRDAGLGDDGNGHS